LETPGIRIRGEQRSEMDRLGDPILPAADVIVLSDSAAAPGR
jgi:hypothetical protein